MRGVSFAMLFVLVGAAACTDEVGQPPEMPSVDRFGVTIIDRTADRLEGWYVSSDGSVNFIATRTDESSGELALIVNGKQFAFSGNLARNLVVFDGGGQILSAQDTHLLAAMAEPLMLALGVADDNDLPYFERLPIRNALYLADAPVGYAHIATVSSPTTRSLGDDGVNRLAKYKLYSGVYDKGYTGRIYNFKATTWKNWGVSECGGGDYGCMGRCGAGCGGAGTNYPYRDCLEHDVCSHNLCAVAGIASTNCGDEYRHALNDFNAN